MAPPVTTYKGRGKATRADSRASPASAASVNTAASGLPEHDVSRYLLSANAQYATLLDKVNSIRTIPDPKSLESMIQHLKSLSRLAEEREDACTASMQESSSKRVGMTDEQRGSERGDDKRVKKEPDDDDDIPASTRDISLKRKRRSKDDRPLALGARGTTKQDGSKRHGKAAGKASPSARRRSASASSVASSPAESPSAAPDARYTATPAVVPKPEDNGEDEVDDAQVYQPEPQPAVPHYQVFGPNPLAFDDPTIYHIRETTPGMTDEEKKEIYNVAVFPKSDLSDRMVTPPPQKDFSNAKPTNQVNATTFANYVEAFARPLMDQDIAFLKEKGDRVAPFLFPRRGKQHYKEKWDIEDGMIVLENNTNTPNQGHGSIDSITDEVAETDQVSAPPLLSRLYSLLRFENRNAPSDSEGPAKEEGDGESAVGDGAEADQQQTPTVDEGSVIANANSATAFPEAPLSSFKVPAAKLEHGQLDERLKAELRYTGIIGQDDNPDYDAHYDDDIAERLRLLQSELRKQIITNNARKMRLLELSKDRLAYQEYKTIHDDLDNQVQQAYLKRTRTLGKAKKGGQHKHRVAGGEAGGAHAPGVGRPGIGDAARTLMDRRKRWAECIGPVIRDCRTTVPNKEESIWDPAVMAELEKAELERWDEEQD